MKRLSYMLLFAIAIASCERNDYTGEAIKDEAIDYEAEPMPVLISLGDAPMIESKGYGTFGDLTGQQRLDSIVWSNAEFYIYSFSKSQDCDMRINWSDSTNTAGSICLIDATRHDSATDGRGKKAKFNTADFKMLDWVEKPDSIIYYNTQDYYKSYDFFAYHIDDCPVSKIDRQRDYIDIDIEFDGTQDIMGGKAALTDAQITAINSKSNRDELLDNYYSTFSANHEISPYIRMNHYLTKVRFELYPGGDLTERGDSSACFEAYVRDISISSFGKATMTVASHDEAQYPLQLQFMEGSQRNMHLKDLYIDDNGNIADSIQFKRLDYNESDVAITDPYMRQPQAIGDYLLVAPAEQMTVNIIMFNDRNDVHYGEEPFHITLTPPDGTESFEAGKGYVVKLAIYGYQQIEAQIDIEPWVDGGSINIDPDDEINNY